MNKRGQLTRYGHIRLGLVLAIALELATTLAKCDTGLEGTDVREADSEDSLWWPETFDSSLDADLFVATVRPSDLSDIPTPTPAKTAPRPKSAASKAGSRCGSSHGNILRSEDVIVSATASPTTSDPTIQGPSTTIPPSRTPVPTTSSPPKHTSPTITRPTDTSMTPTPSSGLPTNLSPVGSHEYSPNEEVTQAHNEKSTVLGRRSSATLLVAMLCGVSIAVASVFVLWKSRGHHTSEEDNEDVVPSKRNSNTAYDWHDTPTLDSGELDFDLFMGQPPEHRASEGAISSTASNPSQLLKLSDSSDEHNLSSDSSGISLSSASIILSDRDSLRISSIQREPPSSDGNHRSPYSAGTESWRSDESFEERTSEPVDVDGFFTMLPRSFWFVLSRGSLWPIHQSRNLSVASNPSSTPRSGSTIVLGDNTLFDIHRSSSSSGDLC